MFRTPRRQPVRPHSEPIERDADALVDAGAPRQTEFVSLLLAETTPAPVEDGDDFPAYFDDSKPVKPAIADINAPPRFHKRKI